LDSCLNLRQSHEYSGYCNKTIEAGVLQPPLRKRDRFVGIQWSALKHADVPLDLVLKEALSFLFEPILPIVLTATVWTTMVAGILTLIYFRPRMVVFQPVISAVRCHYVSTTDAAAAWLLSSASRPILIPESAMDDFAHTDVADDHTHVECYDDFWNTGPSGISRRIGVFYESDHDSESNVDDDRSKTGFHTERGVNYFRKLYSEAGASCTQLFVTAHEVLDCWSAWIALTDENIHELEDYQRPLHDFYLDLCVSKFQFPQQYDPIQRNNFEKLLQRLAAFSDGNLVCLINWILYGKSPLPVEFPYYPMEHREQREHYGLIETLLREVARRLANYTSKALVYSNDPLLPLFIATEVYYWTEDYYWSVWAMLLERLQSVLKMTTHEWGLPDQWARVCLLERAATRVCEIAKRASENHDFEKPLDPALVPSPSLDSDDITNAMFQLTTGRDTGLTLTLLEQFVLWLESIVLSVNDPPLNVYTPFATDLRNKLALRRKLEGPFWDWLMRLENNKRSISRDGVVPPPNSEIEGSIAEQQLASQRRATGYPDDSVYGDQYECAFCKQRLCSADLCYQHLSDQHVLAGEKYKCERCTKVFREKAEIVEHIETCLPSVTTAKISPAYTVMRGTAGPAYFDTQIGLKFDDLEYWVRQSKVSRRHSASASSSDSDVMLVAGRIDNPHLKAAKADVVEPAKINTLRRRFGRLASGIFNNTRAHDRRKH
jgi:hypothetical protein